MNLRYLQLYEPSRSLYGLETSSSTSWHVDEHIFMHDNDDQRTRYVYAFKANQVIYLIYCIKIMKRIGALHYVN